MKPTRREPIFHRFSLLGPSLFLGGALLYAYFVPILPRLFLQTSLVYLLAAFAVFAVQELAFLLAAKLLGFGPYAVYLGVGNTRGLVSFLGTRFGWSSPAPLVSYWLGSTSARAFRLRMLCLSLVRPLSVLALLLVAAHAHTSHALWWRSLGFVQWVVVLAALVELLRVCWTSRRFDAAGGQMLSNGHLLRKALWLNPAKIQANIELAYSLETNLLVSDKKHQKAKQLLFAAIDKYPRALVLRKSLISVAFYVEDYPSARKHALQLAQLPSLSPEERFTLLYQAACAALMSGEVEAAQQEAAVLHAAAPAYAPTRCLLGAIAIQRGQPEQGAAVIEGVLAQDKSNDVQAECYAWLCIAASKQGDTKRAEALLLQARQLNTREQTVRLALQELQEAKTQALAAGTTPYRA